MIAAFIWVRTRAANVLRGAVRCAFPFATLGLFAGLLISDQGKDVLSTLVEDWTDAYSVSGLIFLAAACVTLSLSIWYTLRWLLVAEMPGVPLTGPVGWFRIWLPRVAGALVPLLVTGSVWTLIPDVPDPLLVDYAEKAAQVAVGFAVLALVLALFYVFRGRILIWLQQRGWLSNLTGRAGSSPDALPLATPIPGATLRVIIWTTGATIFAGVSFTIFSVTLPRFFGGAAVAALALASINLFGSFVLTYLPLRRGVPHLAPLALLVAGVCGFSNDNHVVDPAERPASTPANPAAQESFAEFVGTLRGARPADFEVPVLFVASEGGGIRAAYWTAAVLEALRSEVPELEQHLYALSGVSGGSLGIAGWLAERRTAICPETSPREANANKTTVVSATTSLGMDFISPAIAGMFYYDLFQRFLPMPIKSFDRSRAMEDGWQRAFFTAAGRPFEGTLQDFYASCGAPLPHLLLNSTRVETGQRVVLTLLPYESEKRKAYDVPSAGGPAPSQAVQDAAERVRTFASTFDAMKPSLLTPAQTLAGLVHHSARFTLVSPAGTIGEEDGKPVRLVDGGYFDNSGVQTAVELIDHLRERFGKEQPFRPIILIVRNDASEQIGSEAGGWFPETWAVVGTLLAVRGAHAVLIRDTAELRDDIETISLRVPPESAAPLGWALSRHVRDRMSGDATKLAREQAERLRQMLGSGGQ